MPVLTVRQTGLEVLRALCVLALIFLSFGHAPVTAAASGSGVLTAALDMSYCGDLPDDPRAHAPCHACRIGGSADLPPPCSFATPIAVVATVAYGATPVLVEPATSSSPFDARGPPFA